MNELENAYEALVLALRLAITAPTDDKAQEFLEIAESLARPQFLLRTEIERAKKEALQQIERGGDRLMEWITKRCPGFSGSLSDEWDNKLAERARCEYESDDIAISRPAVVSQSEDGAWVQAWVYLGDPLVEEKEVA